MSGTGSVNYQPLIQTAVGGQMDMTQEYLKSILHYNPFTGVFTWKPRPESMFNSLRNCNAWNARYANVVAGTRTKRNYITIQIKPKAIKQAHRLAFLYMIGRCPDITDHINGDSSDNRWANLREATISDNRRNAAKHKHNTSGHTNIRQVSGKWQVVVCEKWFGSYKNINDAIIARDHARATIGGFTKRHGI